MYFFGSIPIMYYPFAESSGSGPPTGFLEITDGTNFLLTDNTPMELAGA